ncbi:MAG: hypothetical protein COT71_02585 [Candidatus Andersenbacteria bacterium CG10_big_fil_rev_8_21_14_0_10_54_11]|uniref:Uncharacterized protein n=1 Tax=Candidatus Andersenbacteria bacterium CG10_big_fil_rev_8_21_14_0_10_54_11 TaxID=1974485 RepID=A0A2M6WZ40_9BACT|nr:MAG: hypothetical protein COT71_02585 [Candidatus Andersenbacteria bacterium CG10_big_fil_rev_8_21_14_0_10_54_11]
MPLLPIEIILAVNGSLAVLVLVLASLMMRLSTQFRLALGDWDRMLSLRRPIILLLIINLFLTIAAAGFNFITV